MIEGLTLMSTTAAVALDSDKLYEIVDGQPEEKEMPGARHSGISDALPLNWACTLQPTS